MEEKLNAPKIVSSAIIGYDIKPVIVNGKVYMVSPPTIHKIAGASYYLSDVTEGKTLKELIQSLGDFCKATHALSWLIQDNDELFEELSQGTVDEVVDALDVAIGMISARNFFKLSISAKSVQSLTANPRR